MSETQFPQTYRNEDGVELVANNEVQAAAFENNGFKPVDKPNKRK
jgi:hypothetical protein